MKVVLKKDVKHLGVLGEIVRVADGYFRNYLKPRDLAVEADSANAKWIEAQQRKAMQRLAVEKDQAAALAEEMGKLDLKLTLKAGKDDKLFGSVHRADIAAKLAEQNYEIDRRKIRLDEPIKKLGLYTIPIRIHPEVEAKVTLLVEKEEEKPS
jgi:large subunit ribosomal protein L9